MTGIIRTSRITALVVAVVLALVAVAAWPPRLAGAEGLDVPAAPAVDISTGSAEELSPSTPEDPTASVRDATGELAPVIEEAPVAEVLATEPVNDVIPQAPDVGQLPQQPPTASPFDPITGLLPPPSAQTPVPLDPVTELLPPPAEIPAPLDPVTEVPPTPPAETPVPLDPIAGLLPLPPAETPNPAGPPPAVIPSEPSPLLEPPSLLPGDPVASTELPSLAGDPDLAAPPAPLAPVLPTDPVGDPIEPLLPQAPSIVPGPTTIIPPEGSDPVPDVPLPAAEQLTGEPPAQSDAGASSQPTAALAPNASPTDTRNAADSTIAVSERSVRAKERSRTRSRTSRARVVSTSNTLTEAPLPAGDGVGDASDIAAPGSRPLPRGLPHDGTGMFVPSTLLDTVAMVATGLVALMLVGFWLRQQRRADDLLPAFPGDLYGDDSPWLPPPSRSYGTAPSLGAGEQDHYESLFSPTIALASGQSNETSTATALRPAPLLAAPASIPEVAPTTARVSLVIPAKNEEKNLPALLPSLPAWLHEVILVDGLSSDATSEVARQCLSGIRIVHQQGRGKGDALREGFAHCTGDIVIAIDADGSMDPSEIATFVAFLESGFDYVKGSRMIAGGSSHDLTPFRRLGNWFFRTLTNVLYTSRYSDLCYGYFGFRRGTIDALDLRSEGFEIETEISIKAHRAGFRTAEVPSNELPRSNGKSNLRAIRDGYRILHTILVSRRAMATVGHAQTYASKSPRRRM